MSSRLTILLPLKGRPLHTLRFFWDAERRRLPYKFLVADGEVHPAVAAVFERARTVFPHVDVDYVRFPDDAGLPQFFAKMASAARMVRTPFVMQADNDDFLVKSGLDHSIEWLSAHADFASYGGGIGGFSLDRHGAALPTVAGAPDHVTFRYGPNYLPRDLSAPAAAERVRQGFNAHALYYHVFRADVLANILAELQALNFSDSEIHETFFCMRALSLGKSRLDGTVMAYFRQMGTSGAHRGGDWVSHLLRSHFTADFDAMAAAIASAVARTDGCDAKTVAEDIRNLYADKLRNDLRARYGAPPRARSRYHPVSVVKQVLLSLRLGWLLDFYRRTRAARSVDPAARDARYQAERATLLAELKRQGAADTYVAAFAREWADIEASFDEQAFLAFVRAQAPELMDANGAARPPQGLAA